MDRLMSREEVCEIVGLTYVTIWHKMQRGEFPRTVALGGHPRNGVRWRQSSIEKWIAELPDAPIKGDKVEPNRKGKPKH